MANSAEGEWRLTAEPLTVLDLDEDVKSEELVHMEHRLFPSSQVPGWSAAGSWSEAWSMTER